MVIHRDLKPANLLIGGVHASKSSISQVACLYSPSVAGICLPSLTAVFAVPTVACTI